jgi:hypothetical protein
MTKLVPILLFALVLSADSSDSKSAKEVLAAMDAYKEAMIHKDGAPLDRLLANDLAYTHSGGQAESVNQSQSEPLKHHATN